MKLFTQPQQITVIKKADQAYAYQVSEGLYTPRTDISRSADKTAWRKRHQQETVGVDSLTMCLNEHFEPLMGRFCELAGEDGDALDWFMRSGPLPGKRTAPARKGEIPDTLQARNLWREKIKQICLKLRKPFPAYPVGILKKQTKLTETSLESYTANALRKCFFALNYSQQRQARAEADIDAPF